MTPTWEENMEDLEAVEAQWSTSTVLTVFFAAALISALFFGLGFSFGRGGADTFGTSHSSTAEQAGVTHPSDTPLQPPSLSKDTALLSHQAYVSKPLAGKGTLETASTSGSPANSAPAQVAFTHPVTSLTLPTHGVPSATPVEGRIMVQVGAIGNRKDALALVSQLRKQGFHAGIYPGPRDKFLHVQLGPFTSTEQAQAVRHRVMAHGYRALLKRTT